MYDSISKAEVTGDPGRGGPRSKVDQGGPPALTHVVVDCHMTQDWQAMCDMVPGAGEGEGGRHACGGQAHTHTHTPTVGNTRDRTKQNKIGPLLGWHTRGGVFVKRVCMDLF
jgi:hypothetical protein